MSSGAFDYKVDFTDLTCLVVPRICSEGNKLLRDHVFIETAEVGGFSYLDIQRVPCYRDIAMRAFLYRTRIV